MLNCQESGCHTERVNYSKFLQPESADIYKCMHEALTEMGIGKFAFRARIFHLSEDYLFSIDRLAYLNEYTNVSKYFYSQKLENNIQEIRNAINQGYDGISIAISAENEILHHILKNNNFLKIAFVKNYQKSKAAGYLTIEDITISTVNIHYPFFFNNDGTITIRIYVSDSSDNL